MARESGPLPLFVGCVLGVAVLCTLLIDGGWMVWIPLGLVLLMVGALVNQSGLLLC